MKIQRPGNTEMGLCFIYFIEENNFKLTNADKLNIISTKKCLIDWLYKTAGYYDKNVPQKEKYTIADYTPLLKKYLSDLLNCYKNSEKIGMFFLKSYPQDVFVKYTENYLNYLNPKKQNNTAYFYMNDLDEYIYNKKVLVISCFKELIEKQINNGNFDVLYNDRYNTTTFINYNYPYKFYNDGPDNNVFETLDKIKKDIENIDFDIAILSCGADGGILTDYIDSHLKKDAIYIGGTLPILFGIIGNRHKQEDQNKYNSYYKNKKYENILNYIITEIPEIYKPKVYKQIENGCYW
jgi:hypothetical protein